MIIEWPCKVSECICMEVCEMILIGDNKELGENPVQCIHVYHKSRIH
jgi:hypothetical protein